MNRRLLIIGAFACYFCLLLGFIAFYLTGPGENALVMAGAFVSSAMMLLVVVFAVLFLRRNASEEYRDKYLRKEDAKDGDSGSADGGNDRK